MTEAYSVRALLGVIEGKSFNLTFSSLPVIPLKGEKKKKEMLWNCKDTGPLKHWDLVARL